MWKQAVIAVCVCKLFRTRALGAAVPQAEVSPERLLCYSVDAA